MDEYDDSNKDPNVYTDAGDPNGYANSQAYEHADSCASNSHAYRDLHPGADYRGANSDSYPNSGEALQGA
jgi:hypothetical protein